MTGVGLWQIEADAPKRLQGSTVGLEQDLEMWIENDSNLLEHGLTIVARQLRTDGGPLDLLGIDLHGRWVLIEIKRERLRREVVAQAIDYASCLDRYEPSRMREQCDAYLHQHGGGTLDQLLQDRGCSLDEDSGMELLIYLVGTGIDTGLERMVSYLGEKANLSIRIVTFSVFEDSQGNKMLAREIHEPLESEAPNRSVSRSGGTVPTEDELLAKADENGIGRIVRPIFEAAVELGLYPRRYSKSFMIAPPQNKTRVLIYIPVDRPAQIRDGRLGIGVWPETFEQFLGIQESEVRKALMQDAEGRMRVSDNSGYVYLDVSGAEEFVQQLRGLLG